MGRPVPTPVVEARAIAKAMRAAGVDLRIKPMVAERISAVLALVDGNRSVAAAMLGINRRSLQRQQARQQARQRRKKAGR